MTCLRSLPLWEELIRPVPPVGGPAEMEETEALPAQVAAIVAAWQGYRDLVLTFRSGTEKLRKAEAESRGLNLAGDYGQFVVGSRETEVELDKIQYRTKCLLVRIAKTSFAPEGVTLTIPEDEWPRSRDAESFNPVWFWRVLEEQFGGTAGRNRAYREAGGAFARELNITRGTEPKMVSGRVVFSTTVHCGEGYEVSNAFRDDLIKVLLGISSIAAWAGIWTAEDGRDWAAVREVIYYGGKDKPPRMAVGEHVLIVAFKERWEFRFSEAFAEQIQLFLNQFGCWYRTDA